jgi:hypothetical protein
VTGPIKPVEVPPRQLAPRGVDRVEFLGGANVVREAGDLCGRILARGHARLGDSIATRAYCRGSDRLDRAVTEFADAYAAQNLEDFGRFRDAIDAGRLEVADVV